ALTALIEDKFSGTWHELQPREGPLEFNPTPFIADQKTVARGFHEPYWLPGFLDSNVFGSDQSVRELFVDGGVYAGAMAETQVAFDRASPQEAAFAEAMVRKDADMVRNLLSHGLSPDTPIAGRAPILFAAHQGALELVKLLVEAGADVNTEDHGISP